MLLVGGFGCLELCLYSSKELLSVTSRSNQSEHSLDGSLPVRGQQSLAKSLTRERDREAVREVGQFYFGDGRKYFIDIFLLKIFWRYWDLQPGREWGDPGPADQDVQHVLLLLRQWPRLKAGFALIGRDLSTLCSDWLVRESGDVGPAPLCHKNTALGQGKLCLFDNM